MQPKDQEVEQQAKEERWHRDAEVGTAGDDVVTWRVLLYRRVNSEGEGHQAARRPG
ncbi:MAG: hypothetical protein R2706_19455 [Acidimicrobiales bacterium]